MTGAAPACPACSCVLALPKVYAGKSKRQTMRPMLHITVLKASRLMGRLSADHTFDEGKHPHYTPCTILDGKPHGGLNMHVSKLLLRTHHSPDSKASIRIGCLASCCVREDQRRELLRERLLAVLLWLFSELLLRLYVVS